MKTEQEKQTEHLRRISNNLQFFFYFTLIPVAIVVALYGVKFLMAM